MIKIEQACLRSYEKGMVKNMKIQIGESIKRLRREKNITQEAFSATTYRKGDLRRSAF
jgi:hypothetical protein